MQTGHKSPLLVAPCGSGKTVMFSYFAKTVTSRGKRTLILAHRDELIEQISGTLKTFDVNHSFIAAGRFYSRIPHVHVGSVFTVVRRLRDMPKPDIIIIDEAHHAKASTYEKIFQAFPNAWRIGVTASPIRLSGESLGDIFDDLILGPTVKDLTEAGFLSPYKLYVPASIDTSKLHMRGGDYAKNELAELADKPKITGSAIAEYKKYADRKRAIAFCVSVKHAEHVAQQFCEAGYKAISIDGKLARDVRQTIVRRFRDGEFDVLTSCDLVSEGFDLPSIECAIMLRPTASKALWIQQSGRALRIHPGKTQAILLDHANNTMTHGLPDETHEWSLNGKQKTGKDFISPVKICPQCFAAQSPSNRCAFCGFLFPIISRQVESVDGILEEVNQEQLALKLKWKREQGMSQGYKELVELGMARGFKRPEAWAHIIIRAREAKKAKAAI